MSSDGFGQSLRNDTKTGLTFEALSVTDAPNSGVFIANCNSKYGSHCNPIKGETPCDSTRPLLCFLDIDAPVPQTLEDGRHWTGGILAITSAQPGHRFSTLKDTNDFCAATFGPGWRVASFHDGGGQTLKGYGAPPLKVISVWLDIKDQPNATCWTR